MKTKEQLIDGAKDLTKAIVNFHDFPLTNSLAIAVQFGKEHYHVMRDIKNFSEWLNSATDPKLEALIYFISENHYLDNKGEERPFFIVNKNVALFIIMGYTGDEAKHVKLDFINRFNELEKEVSDKRKEYAGSKGGYKGHYLREKARREELEGVLNMVKDALEVHINSYEDV